MASGRPVAAAPVPNDRPEGSESRVEPARRRARIAKVTLVATGALVFGGAMGFARLSFAGHTKSPAQPLTAPPRFVRIVRHNLLQAGIIAPAEAPPGSSTSVS